MKKKPYTEWTRKELEALPLRKWNENIGIFQSIIILPKRSIHDSGFRHMDFVAVKEQIPFCRLSGCSDVLHIDGIGGFGQWDVATGIPTTKPIVAWSIDCLPKSGLLRFFF